MLPDIFFLMQKYFLPKIFRDRPMRTCLKVHLLAVRQVKLLNCDMGKMKPYI